jgi:molybdenum cofactor cytidylyltransferase
LKFGTVILAAGASQRMGRPKLLLPWGSTSVLGHQIKAWKHLGSTQVCVVHAAADSAMLTELERLNVPLPDRIVNTRPEQGMFHSIRSAAMWNGWLSELTHIVISLGDQPHLCLETLQAVLCLTAEQPGKVCQPRYNGHTRHPVILPVHAFHELRETSASTLKEFLASKSIASREINDPGLDLDIDEAADYDRALRISKLAD